MKLVYKKEKLLHRVLPVAFAVGCCLSAAAESKDALVVTFVDNSSQIFILEDTPKVTFNDASMHIASLQLEEDYNVADVKTFTFDTVETNAVAALHANETRLTFIDGKNVLIEGLTANEQVRIYDVNGRQLRQTVANNSGSASVSVADLNAGVYIISALHNNYKIIKR